LKARVVGGDDRAAFRHGGAGFRFWDLEQVGRKSEESYDGWSVAEPITFFIANSKYEYVRYPQKTWLISPASELNKKRWVPLRSTHPTFLSLSKCTIVPHGVV